MIGPATAERIDTAGGSITGGKARESDARNRPRRRRRTGQADRNDSGAGSSRQARGRRRRPAKAVPTGRNDGAAAEPGMRKPLVPVTPVSMAGGPTDAAAIRRLPPVEQSGTNSVSAQGGELPAGSDPRVSDHGD